MGKNAREPDVGPFPSRDMHAQGNITMGQQPSNPFVERTMGLQYNMALTYVILNEQNACVSGSLRRTSNSIAFHTNTNINVRKRPD